MSALAELVQRAERLEKQAESLRDELAQLRKDLAMLHPQGTPNGTNGASKSWLEAAAEMAQDLGPEKQGPDCLAVALSLAQNLGPEFSSEKPHTLAGRGEGWFDEK